MRRIALASLIALVIANGLFPPLAVFAAVGPPLILMHQGRLLDSSGNLLGGSSGTNYCFRFSIFDDGTVGAPDNRLWPASAPSTMTVNVRNGVYNVGVGDTSAGGDLLNFDFNTTDSAYLNIEVANQVASSCTGVTFENLAPRERIDSSGYALNAKTLMGSAAAQSASGNEIPILTSGNLVLGGTNPQVNATGSNTLTVQSGATGNVNFFSAANHLTSSGDLTLAGGVNASGDSNYTFTGTNNLAVTSNLGGTTDALSVIGTASGIAGTAHGIAVTQGNSASSSGFDASLFIDNADTDLQIPSAIEISNSGGGGYGNILTSPTLNISNAGALTGVTNITASGTISTTGAFTGGTVTGTTINATTALQTGGVSRIDNAGNLINIGNLTGTGAVTIASTGGTSNIILSPAGAVEDTGDLVVDGNVTAAGFNLTGDIDMQTNKIINIGNAGTDFTAAGGLNLAGALAANGGETIGADQNLTLANGSGMIVVNNTVTNASKKVINISPSYTGGATDGLNYSVININDFAAANASGNDSVTGVSIGNLTDPGATISSTALVIGSGWDTAINVNGTPITAAQLALLSGHDAPLIDTNDAVNTTITGTGPLNSGSITAGFGSINTGSDNITTTGTVTGGTMGTAGTTVFTGNTGTFSGLLSANGGISTTTISGFTATGDVDMGGNIITNIGSPASSFTGTGGLNLAGDLVANGNTTIGDASSDQLTVNSTIQGGTPLSFEGSTVDGNKTNFVITDPTATRTITFPNASIVVNAAGDLSGTTLASNVVNSSLTTVGALNSGSIASGFGAISTTNPITTTGTIGTAAVTTFTGGDATFAGTTNATGDVNLGTSPADTVTVNGTMGGDLDMGNFIVKNIGNAGTDFVSGTGALNLAGVLTANGGVSVGPNQDVTFQNGSGSLVMANTATNASDNVVDLSPSFSGATNGLNYNVINVNNFTSANTTGTDNVTGVNIGNLTDPGASINSVALHIGSGWDTAIDVNGTPVTAAQLVLLSGHDAPLVDTNDAVNTAITGTGPLTSGSIAPGFGSISTANPITTTNNISTTGTGTITSAGTLTASNDLVVNGNTTLGDTSGDKVTVNGIVQGATPLVFEGSTIDGNTTSFIITDPTAPRSITFPNASIVVNAAGDLSGTTLASNVVNSSLTSTGTLSSGSIASGFGSISTTNPITTTGTIGTAGTTTFQGGTANFGGTTVSSLTVGAINLAATGTSDATSGASLVGVYNTGFTQSSSTTVQGVLRDLDAAVFSLGAGASNWTDAGAFSYLAQTSDNVAMGGSTEATAPFDMVVGATPILNLGIDSSKNGQIKLYSSGVATTDPTIAANSTGNLVVTANTTSLSGNVALPSTTPTVAIGNTGTLSFTDGTNPLMTLADQGTTGLLTVSGDVQIGSTKLSAPGSSESTSGATLVGAYTGDFTQSSSSTVQGVLKDFDSVINGLTAGSSNWVDGGAFSYLAQTSDNLAVGGSTEATSPFDMVVGATPQLNLGINESKDGSIKLYSSGVAVTDPTIATDSSGNLNLTTPGNVAVTGGETVSGTSTANGTFNANGPVNLGDGGDLIAIDSSSWDISSGGAMTGIPSLDTIATSSTALTFAGAGTVSSTTTSPLTIDSGTTGAVNVGTGNNAKTINVGTGTAGDAINIGTDNTTADTIGIGSAKDAVTTTGTTIADILNTTSSATFASNTANTDTIAIKPQTTTTTASFTGTITSADLTAARTWTLPDSSGTLSLTSTGWQIGGNAPGATSILGTTDNSAITLQTGSGALNIDTGANTGNVAIGNATGTLALTSAGGLNVSTAGALTGVASIDTIAHSATAITFAGTGSIATGAGTALNLDGGTTGAVNIGSTSTGDILLGGGSGSTGCTVTNSTGAFTCAGNVSTPGNISTTGTGTITSAGLLTGSAGLTVTGAAVNLNASSNFPVNIATGTSTGAVTIGGSGNTVAIDSSNWDVSSAGAITGLTGFTQASGAFSDTLSTTNSATFGSTTANTDSIALKPQTTTTTASFTGTITTADLTAARTYTLPDASGTLLTSGTGWLIGGNAPGASSVFGTTDNSAVTIQTGSGALNIDTTSTGNVAIGNSTGTFSLTDSGGLNVSTAGALTGVASLDTIATSAAALTFAAAGTIKSTTTSALTVDSGTTGTLNLGTGNNAKTINVGTGTAGDHINIGTDNTTADTIAIGSPLDTFSISSTGLVVSTAGVMTSGSIASGFGSISTTNAITTTGAISTTGTGTITSAGDFAANGNTTIGDAGTDLLTVNAALNSDINMNNHLLTNIGAAGTNFTAGGGLTLASTLTANGVANIGDGGDAVTINSSSWGISSGGNETGIGTIGMGGQLTISGVANDITTGTNEDLTLAPNGSGSVVVNPDTNSSFKVTATGVPTADLVQITNAGQGTTTNGVDGISSTIFTATGAGANNSALHGVIGNTPVDASDVVNGLEVSGNGTGNIASTTENLALLSPASLANNVATTLNGLNIGALGTNQAAATETAINIGSGWDNAINTNNGNVNFGTGTITSGAVNSLTVGTSIAPTATATALNIDAGTSGAINIGSTSTGDILLGGGSGSTGCTVTNASGNLTCTGNITGATTGTAGYWSRSGTNLSTATAGDTVTLGGQLIMSGVTSDITTGTNEDLTLVPNGSGSLIFNQDANSNFQMTATGAPVSDMLALTNAGQGTTTNNVDGVSSSIATATGAGANNSALHATILNAPVDSGDVINGLESTGIAQTVAGTTQNLALLTPPSSGDTAGTLNGLNIGAIGTPGAASEVAINIGSGWDTALSAAGAITTSGNISATGSGTITSAGTLTASNGLTETTGAINLTGTSGALALSGLSASSVNTGANNLTITSGNFNTTATGINSTAIGASTASTGSFTTLASTGATTLGNNSSTVAIDSTSWDVSSAGAISGLTGYTQASGAFAATLSTTNSASFGSTTANTDSIAIKPQTTTTTAPFTGTITSADLTAARTYTLPDASGTFAVSASGPLALSAAGNLTCTTCTTGSTGWLIGGNALGGTSILGSTDNSAVTIQTGSGALNIDTGSTGNVAVGNSTGTFALTSSGGLNVSTAGALTGVASLDTIATSATALTFAGAGTVSSTTSSALTLDSGTTGAVNLGTGNNAKTINVGTGTAGDTINIGTDNTVADTIGIGSAKDALTLTGTTIAHVLNTTSSATFASNTANTDSIAIKPQTTTATASFTGTITSADLTAARTYTLPDASGTFAVSASGPLALDAAGNLTCSTCAVSGGSLFTLAGSSGSQVVAQGSTVTVSAGTNITTPETATNTITVNVVNNPTFSGLVTASNGLTLTTGALNMTATSGALALSGLSASSINSGSNDITFTSGHFDTTATGINSTAIGASTASTGSFTTLASTGATTLGNNSSTVAIDSTSWDVSSAGAISGLTGYTQASGAFAATLSTTNSASFGSTTANTDSIAIKPQTTTTTAPFTGTITSADLTAARTYTLPDASGTFAVSASGPLALSAAGNLTCATCATSGSFWSIGGNTAPASPIIGATDGSAISLQTGGAGTLSVGDDANADSIDIGNAAATVKTITIGGSGANVITIGNTQTGGSIAMGAAMSTGTIAIGGAQTSGTIAIGGGVQTGTITFGGGTGAQIVNLGTGGTGVKTVHIADGSAANVITIGTTQTAGSIALGSAMTTGTIDIGNSSGAMTGTINIGGSTGAQSVNIAGGGTGVKTVAIAGGSAANVITIGNTQTGGSIAMGAAMSTGTIAIGGAQTSGTIAIGGGVQTGTITFGGGTGAQIVNLGTGGTGVKTVHIADGSAANVITIGTTQTAGSIALGSAMTTGTIDIGNSSGAMTGTINIGGSTGAQSLNFGGGGTGVKTVAIAGGSAANVITIGNTQTAGSIAMGGAMTTGTIDIGNSSGAMTGTINIGGSTGAQSVNIAGGGTGVKTVGLANGSAANVLSIANTQTAGSIAMGTAMTTGTIRIGGGTGNVTIGTSDTTGTLLVLDTKTGAGDPTGTNGGMYYNSNTNTFRCFENSAWKDCLHNSSATSFGPTTFAGTQPTPGAYPTLGTYVTVMTSGTEPTITPSASTARLLITGVVQFIDPTAGHDTEDEVSIEVWRATTSGGGCTGTQVPAATAFSAIVTDPLSTTNVPFTFIDSPATAAARFYTVCASESDDGTGTDATIGQVEMSIQEIGASGADLAESYATNDSSIAAGTVVSIDPSLTNGVMKSSGAYDASTLGIVTTRPGVVLDDGSINGQMAIVALAGRVPVKVSNENGPIAVGDYLTTSSTPGVAMKATEAGVVIGQALSAWDGSADPNGPSVMAFIKNFDWNGKSASVVPPPAASTTPVTQVADATSTDPSALTVSSGSALDVGAALNTVNDSIAALQTSVAALQTSVTANTTQIAQNTTDLADLANQFNTFKSDTAVQLASLSSNGLDLSGPLSLAHGLIVNNISSIADMLTFNNDVTFIGRPYVNADTAGFAVVHAGDTRVKVTFDKSYIDAPVVTSTISQAHQDDAQAQADAEQAILASGINSIVTDVSTDGFTIRLSAPAPVDMTFSWIALAVHNAHTFFSTVDPSNPSPVVEQPIVAPPMPSANDSGSSADTTTTSDASTTADTTTTDSSVTTDTTTADTSATTDPTTTDTTVTTGTSTSTDTTVTTDAASADTSVAAPVDTSTSSDSSSSSSTDSSSTSSDASGSVSAASDSSSN